ncbi:carboxypeptidase regulatory-like domain-containing protein, partial [bacterium AH-315-B15]|nr:carboxypeptidase regulatory-like domain-containing protein [bacterium AH-315-B15]
MRISGIIKDKDGHPIPRARCWFKNDPKNKVASDENGKYAIKYQIGSFDTLIFYAVGFDSAVVKITPRMEKKSRKTGGYLINVVLPERVFNIVTIRPEQPDTMHGTQAYSVSDFAYNENDQLILLTYYKTLRRGSSLRLLDEKHEVVDSLELNEESIELQNDFRNNIHLITDKKVYRVKVEEGKLHLYQEDREFYLKNVAPIVDTLGHKVYYSTYSEVYPAFDYYEYDVRDSSHSKLIYIEDTFIMPFYRAEFKYLPQRTKLD